MGLILDPDYGQTPLTSEEKDGLKISVVQTKKDLAGFEAGNISRAKIWLDKSKDNDFLSINFCLKVHKKMFNDVWSWAGKIRKTDKNIGVPKHQIQIELKKLFDDFRFWIDNNTFQTDEIFVRFHHRMVYIHPFANGNGRHSRMYTDFLLVKYGHEPFSWGSKNPERRKLYIKAIIEADQKKIKPLINFARS